MIREGYLDSEAYAQVDDLAKLVWHHMVSLADDEGWVSVSPNFLRRHALFCEASDAQIAQIVAALNFADLITLSIHEPKANVLGPFVYFRPHIPESLRKKVYAADGYVCAECGSAERLSVDHIVPVAKGGTNAISNLRTLCAPCNSSKGAR